MITDHLFKQCSPIQAVNDGNTKAVIICSYDDKNASGYISTEQKSKSLIISFKKCLHKFVCCKSLKSFCSGHISQGKNT